MNAVLQSLYNFFSYIKDLISDIGSLFRKVITLLGSALSYIKIFVSIFPAWLSVSILVLVAVCILYKVLGREGAS